MEVMPLNHTQTTSPNVTMERLAVNLAGQRVWYTVKNVTNVCTMLEMDVWPQRYGLQPPHPIVPTCALVWDTVSLEIWRINPTTITMLLAGMELQLDVLTVQVIWCSTKSTTLVYTMVNITLSHYKMESTMFKKNMSDETKFIME